MTPYKKYAQDVVYGKIDACTWVKLACDRFLKDLKRDWEYYFDEEQADRYIAFIQLLRLTKGEWAGKPMILEPWQSFIAANIFGWRVKGTGYRRFTEATINVPKKNTKTETSAAFALAVAFMDEEYGGQIYMAATAREQAGLCFSTAKSMVKLTPDLSEYFTIWQHSIVYDEQETSIKAISAEASTAEGKGANCVVFDEEHEQVTNELRDNLISGMAARRQPLFISISTAGTDRNKPYYKHLQKCQGILSGNMTDDRHFIIIYSADETDDWKLEKTWKKANPMYGISVKPDFIKKQFTETQNEPSKEPNFKTKHLDIWTDAHTTWVPNEVFLKGKRDFDLSEFTECWCGLDLASSLDFTALAILCKKGDDFYCKWMFWIPEEMAEKRTQKDKIRFQDWARMGYITLTPGNVTDYDFVQQDILNLAKRIKINSVAYDPANASQLVTNLTDEGVNMMGFSQGIMNISPATKAFERSIFDGKFMHDANPVMGWMMGNVHIFRDANDNMKIHKGKSTDKVDGPVATADAFGAHLYHQQNKPQTVFAV